MTTFYTNNKKYIVDYYDCDGYYHVNKLDAGSYRNIALVNDLIEAVKIIEKDANNEN